MNSLTAIEISLKSIENISQSDISVAAVGSQNVIVTPGQIITSEQGYLRGHGTYVQNGCLVASLAGVVERVNKLISVRPLRSRYIGEVGDIVVGRITEVGNNRWKVDVNGLQDGVLMLSSVNLPGGVQRRRTYEDQLQMRSLMKEHDLISAEVQEVRHDGTMSLHTRSLKYGKLENGHFITVPPALIRRLKNHTLTLTCGVDIILGNNGYIWLTYKADQQHSTGEDGQHMNEITENMQKQQERHAATEIGPEGREKIARVRNAIVCLRAITAQISPSSIMEVYDASEELNLSVPDMVSAANVRRLTVAESARRVAAFADDDEMDTMS